MTDTVQTQQRNLAFVPAPGTLAPKTPMTLYMIRHGEPECEWLNCYYGQMDVPLSEKGKEQSRRVAERLATVPFDAVYCSDLSRTCYLADLLAEAHDLPVRRLEVLRERHMGAMQGIDREILERDHAEQFTQWLADRVYYRVPEAENFEDVHRRIVPAIQELTGAFAGRRVALVGHAGPIRVALAWAMGLPLDHIFRIRINHCSINVIEAPPDGPPIVTLVNG